MAECPWPPPRPGCVFIPYVYAKWREGWGFSLCVSGDYLNPGPPISDPPNQQENTNP